MSFLLHKYVILTRKECIWWLDDLYIKILIAFGKNMLGFLIANVF